MLFCALDDVDSLPPLFHRILYRISTHYCGLLLFVVHSGSHSPCGLYVVKLFLLWQLVKESLTLF